VGFTAGNYAVDEYLQCREVRLSKRPAPAMACLSVRTMTNGST